MDKVNFSVKTQAFAYAEGMKDGMAMLIDMLVDGGDINYLLEGIANNARPETVAKMEAYYDGKRREYYAE